jgi:hypothetical protein
VSAFAETHGSTIIQGCTIFLFFKKETKQKAFVPFALRSGRLLRESANKRRAPISEANDQRKGKGERNTRERERQGGGHTHADRASERERSPSPPAGSDLTLT